MKIVSIISTLLISFSFISFSQTVTIGTQVWMDKNLDVSTFRNGDPIPEVKTIEEWVKAGENKQPAWCYYENDPVNGTKYGKLYNWHAVNDPRGLAPLGYHIPTSAEWTILIDFLGGKSIAGKKLKSTKSYDRYKGKKDNSTNEFGFSGLPGGGRNEIGRFGKLPQKLKRFEIESVKQKLYEKFKIYGVTNRCDFKTSRRWHVSQRDLSSTRHQPTDIF